jgi:hypothetical protein
MDLTNNCVNIEMNLLNADEIESKLDRYMETIKDSPPQAPQRCQSIGSASKGTSSSPGQRLSTKSKQKKKQPKKEGLRRIQRNKTSTKETVNKHRQDRLKDNAKSFSGDDEPRTVLMAVHKVSQRSSSMLLDKKIKPSATGSRPRRAKSADDSIYCSPKRTSPRKKLLSASENSTNGASLPISTIVLSPAVATTPDKSKKGRKMKKGQSSDDLKRSKDKKEQPPSSSSSSSSSPPSPSVSPTKSTNHGRAESPSAGVGATAAVQQQDEPVFLMDSSDHKEALTLRSLEMLVRDKIININATNKSSAVTVEKSKRCSYGCLSAASPSTRTSATSTRTSATSTSTSTSMTPPTTAQVLHREPTMVWKCSCGYSPKKFQKFCGMCGTPQHWKCAVAGCHYDSNLAVFGFCGMCGIVRGGGGDQQQQRPGGSSNNRKSKSMDRVAQ